MKKNAQQKLKHKPNARHTLNEVLHSLQDMMHNELAGIADEEGSETKGNSGTPRSKEEILDSLKALIGEPGNTPQFDNLASPDEAVESPAVDDSHKEHLMANDVLEPDPVAEESIEDSDLDDLIQDEEIVLEEIPVPPLEEELPQDNINDDVISADEAETETADTDAVAELPNEQNEAPSPADDFRLEMEDTRETEPDTPRKAPEKVKKKSQKNKNKSTAANAVEQVEINWDDIPVLNEVVAPPPEPDEATSQEARAIAIKVAAALNIEARKKGGDAMNIKTIMRLQSLLGQELQERQDSSDEPDDNESGDD